MRLWLPFGMVGVEGVVVTLVEVTDEQGKKNAWLAEIESSPKR